MKEAAGGNVDFCLHEITCQPAESRKQQGALCSPSSEQDATPKGAERGGLSADSSLSPEHETTRPFRTTKAEVGHLMVRR